MSENIALIVAIIVLMPYMVRHIICVSVMDFTISNTLGLSLITKTCTKKKKQNQKITYDTVLLSQTTFLRFYTKVQHLMQAYTSFDIQPTKLCFHIFNHSPLYCCNPFIFIIIIHTVHCMLLSTLFILYIVWDRSSVCFPPYTPVHSPLYKRCLFSSAHTSPLSII